MSSFSLATAQGVWTRSSQVPALFQTLPPISCDIISSDSYW
jgi:hypothetical protein